MQSRRNATSRINRAEQVGQNIRFYTVCLNRPRTYNYYSVGNIQNALLVRNYHYRATELCVHFFKYLYKVAEAPQVDSSLWLVKNSKLGRAGKHGCYFNSFKLAARKGRIDLAVNIIPRAKTDLRKIFACLVNSDLFTCGKTDKVIHRKPLEMYRLLKCKADAAPCALGNGQAGYILPVKEYSAGRGGYNARNYFGKGGFTAAVWPCYYNKAFVYFQTYVFNYFFFAAV